MDPELINTLGQLVLIALGAVATILPVWVRNAFNKAFAYKIVQDAALWAARKAVARLSNPDEKEVVTEAEAADVAAKDLQAAAGDSLKRLGADAKAIAGRRVADLLWGSGQ